MVSKVASFFQSQRRTGASFFEASLRLLSLVVRKLSNNHYPNVIQGYKLYNKPLLMSYSRSGTNWLRYFIETVSGQPTPGEKRLLEGDDFIIDRAHKAFLVAHKHPKIILLLRNYRECMVRHHGIEEIRKHPSIASYLSDEKSEQPAGWYLANLQAFDQYHGEKLLLYYEDLITNPKETLVQLSEFLELDSQSTKSFISNLDDHQSKSLELYTRTDHRSETKGNTDLLNFHSNKLTTEEIHDFDWGLKESVPGLFAKYLERYESNA